MTDRIVDLDKDESGLILGYVFDVYKKKFDIQVRFRWTPRKSAMWDNRYVCSCIEVTTFCMLKQVIS